MFTKLFWKDAIERAIKTMAQTLLSIWIVSDTAFDLFSISWEQSLSVAFSAAVLSIVMSIGSAKKAGTDTASLVVDTKEL